MGSAFGGLANAISAPLNGLLDFRQQLINQRNDLLNPMVQGVMDQRAKNAQDTARHAIGQTGEGVQLHGEQGLYTDLGPARGLLADPRFQDNQSELTFASRLLGTPGTAKLGENLLSNIVTQQQNVDTVQAAAQSKLLADARKAQETRFNNNRNAAMSIADDIRSNLSPYVEQVTGLQGLYDNLQNGSPADAVATVFQFMQAIEPGGIVREGEQGMVRGIGGLFTQLANQLNQVAGRGLDGTLRRELADTVTRIMQPRIEQAQADEAGFRRQIEAAQLGKARGVATSALPNIQMPALPQIVQGGQGAQTPVPAGLTPGRRPREDRRRSGRGQGAQ